VALIRCATLLMRAFLSCVIFASTLASIALLTLQPAYSKDQVLQFYTHSIKDTVIADENGKLVGVANGGRRAVDVEIVRWIIADLGLKNNIQELPFKRALRKVQREDNVVLFNILRTSERDNTMQWIGPIDVHRSYFYESVDRPTKIETLDDAKNVKSICVYSGNVQHTALIKLGFTNLIPASSYAQCVILLHRGRAMLFPASEKPLFLNYSGAEKVKRTDVIVNSNESYLGVSLNVSQETLQQLQASLDRLKNSQDYLDILKKYSD
jgi:polar amino acid transport system substrate-binding protein